MQININTVCRVVRVVVEVIMGVQVVVMLLDKVSMDVLV